MIALRRVSKAFGKKILFADLNADFEGKEIHLILGPSGCGKTTLLRLIAGLDVPDAGEILLENQVATQKERIIIPPHKRQITFAFQAPSLWPHMSAMENVLFGLHGLSRNEARRRAREALDLVGAFLLADRKPSDLSGGEMRRISLARALAPRPRILLLDEPLAHLDSEAKAEMIVGLQRALEGFDGTVLYVTHDPSEAPRSNAKVFRLPAGESLT